MIIYSNTFRAFLQDVQNQSEAIHNEFKTTKHEFKILKRKSMQNSFTIDAKQLNMNSNNRLDE